MTLSVPRLDQPLVVVAGGAAMAVTALQSRAAPALAAALGLPWWEPLRPQSPQVALAALARAALDAGCGRLELAVKTDNRARAFYERLGLTRKGTWLPYAVSGEGLRDLAAATD